MHLIETQQLFTHSLQTGSDDALRLLQDNDRIPPQLALAIYRNNHQGALIKALEAAYPACRRILGERCFNSLAQRFVEQTPSQQPDLNLYGAAFGDYLDECTTDRVTLSDYAYLGDLARLEWLCHTAYYAADDPAFDFESLAGVPPDAQGRLCLRTSHSLGLLASDYPVREIRQVNLSADAATQVNGGDPLYYLVVSRPEYRSEVARVDAVTFELLCACRAGKSLADISAAAADQSTLTTTLPALIAHGWITGFGIDRSGNDRSTANA